MKTQLYIPILFIALFGMASFGFSQSIVNRIKMHRFSKEIENGVNPNDILHFKDSFDYTILKNKDNTYVGIGNTRVKGTWYYFMLEYNRYSLSEDYVAFDQTLSSIDCKDNRLERDFKNETQKLLDFWKNMNNGSRRKIERRYPNSIERVRLWNTMILERIESCKSVDPCAYILLEDLDSLVNDQCCDEHNQLTPQQRKRCDDAKKPPEPPIVSKSEKILYLESQKFIDDFADQFGEKLIRDIRSNNLLGTGDSIKVLVQRRGKSMVLAITPFFKEHEKNFTLGSYLSENINDVFRIYAGTINEYINDTMNIVGQVQGEADANAMIDNSLQYIYGSDEWGVIDDSVSRDIYPAARIRLIPGQYITNLDLAFLRAYQIKKLLQSELKLPDIFERIIAIDHTEVDSNHKGGKYRNVTAQIVILDFFGQTEIEEYNTNDCNINVNNRSLSKYLIYDMD